MKQLRSTHPPITIPRSGSLFLRLQTAPGQEDPPYFDQLMTFLETPPSGIHDRWKEGAQMCSAWGIPCTGASVWRLYRSHVLAWRLRLANEAGSGVTESEESLHDKTAQMVALRIYEVLANPDAPSASLIGLARIEFRKKVLEFARQKYEDSERARREKARAGKIAAGNFLEQFAASMKSTAAQAKLPAQP